MSNLARDRHRQMDTAAAEAMACDGGADGQPDIARPKRWKTGNVSGGRNKPKVLLVKLSQRTSGKGTIYLSGWMGSARLVGFLDKEPDKNGDPVWNVYAAEPRPGLAGGARQRVYETDSGR
jgi:hypothetical protein